MFTCDDVHDEEEEGGADSPGGGGHDLHDHREQDGEPGLRKQVVQGWRRRTQSSSLCGQCGHAPTQRYEAVGRLEVDGEGGEGGGQHQEPGLHPQPGVQPEPDTCV